MEELLEAYEEMFGEPFPFMMAMGMDDEEIRDTLEDCLVTGKPHEPDVPREAKV